MEKTIYVADDEKNIRDLLSGYLLKSGYLVRTFSNGDDLLQAFSKAPADLVVLDIMMPGTDGLSICRSIREKSNVPVIMVSARGDEFDRITGINIGADDYLTKPFSVAELVARVNRIFTRLENSASDGVISFEDMYCFPKQRLITCNGKPCDLTVMEYNFLYYLLTHQDVAISRNELLRSVWSVEAEVGGRVIDDLVKRLRKKISETGSIAEIYTIRGFGFILAVKKEECSHD